MSGNPLEILSNAEMREADRLTIETGTPGYVLMEAAGHVVVDEIIQKLNADQLHGPFLVLCGPGNNGGDGFVIARLLSAAGHEVDLRLLGTAEKLSGDAALMAGKWTGSVLPLESGENYAGFPTIVDALFGSGLARPIAKGLAKLIQSINSSEAFVVSVDIPSGVDGNSGAILGSAIEADLTVTFFRKKPGHLLLPGGEFVGELIVRDIGIDAAVLDKSGVSLMENGPALWLSDLKWPERNSHKHSRGHAIVFSGGAASTGAARLAAYAALRSGAGLVTIASPTEAVEVIASQVTAVMVKEIKGVADVKAWLGDTRITSVLIGPGNGVSSSTRDNVLAARATAKNLVLDADALTVFEDDPAQLFELLDSRCVLTPHEGEFRRLFKANDKISKVQRVKDASQKAGAVILLKGADTIIADPEGRCVISVNGSPWLATAGSGDVLGGIITGLIAQGVPSFEAACAGAWIHGASGNLVGPGLIAEDLVSGIPACLSQLAELVGRKFSS